MTGVELVCLALTIYFEARSEDLNGQVAVGQVVLNRVEDFRFPDTVCEVVWQDRQFSWTHDGKPDRPYNRDAWAHAQYVAEMLAGGTRLPWLKDALWYHADYVEPQWAAAYVFVGQAGRHRFYTGGQ